MPNMKFSSIQDAPCIAGPGNSWGSGSHPNPPDLKALIRREQAQFKQILPGGSLDPGLASGVRR